MADIITITLPDNLQYNIQDAVSRSRFDVREGTGTAGQAGSSSVAYRPALWTYDLGMTPVAGDIVTITVPVAGVNAGVWMSVDNGSHYYPIAVNNKTRLTTQYAINNQITLIYQTGLITTTYGTDTSGAAAGAAAVDLQMDRWCVLNYYDANTTYSNASLGQGYATCSTAEATAAKVATLSSYALTIGGIVAVKFTYAVPANATLNVNSKGAKAIYYKGAKITAGVIKAGDIAYFIYSTYYHLIGIDRTAGLSSLSAASGGTAESLVTTGEKYTWNSKTSNTGTVTSVATGAGLTGGTISTSGTIKADLTSETKLTNAAADGTETSGRVYPVRLDKNGKLAVNVPWTDSTPVTSVAGKTGAVTLSNSDVGLGNVENKSSATIRGELTSSNVTTALGYTPLNSNLKGANNGLAELGSDGKVPSSQLPSYVDDVLEYTSQSAFPATGESGKIYIAQDTNKTYRWSGTAYVEISESLALGTTSSTAFRGDYGNSAYTHAVTNKGSAFTSGMYKITTNSEGHVTAATAIAKSDITGLGIPTQDTTYTLTQDQTDGHIITLTPSSGSAMTITIPDNDTTYSSKTAASGGTDVSLVTTGEKYTWNNKANLPTVSSSDNGKALIVSSGAWAKGDIPTELPSVSSSDNGKVLRVVNGVWAAASLPSATGVSF